MRFRARYDGRCSDCGEPIEAGNLVEYAGVSLVHVDCEVVVESHFDRIAEAEHEREVCDDCWLLKPCPCEDGL